MGSEQGHLALQLPHERGPVGQGGPARCACAADADGWVKNGDQCCAMACHVRRDAMSV